LFSSFERAEKTQIDLAQSIKSGDIPVSPLSKGKSLLNLRRFKDALEHFDVWLRDYGLNTKNMQKTIEILYPVNRIKGTLQYKELVSDVLVGRANALQGLGHTQMAIDSFKQALGLNRNNASGWYHMAEVLFNKLGDLNGAIAAYEESLRLEPGDDMAWNSLGFVLSEQGNKELALQCYDKALEINSRLAIASGNKGVLLMEMGRNREAKFCFDKLVKIEPGNALGWYYKALLSPANSNEAIECIEKAVLLEPKNFHFINALQVIKRRN
jgi:tetratricopeptide (TPR) repeat protein